ncbi:hypothetical protein CANCADRAFT_60 [Tortispora caseinolytica NRRL Y-17796]|uniref:LIM zinc-binding domain-containing protein n=1 Tax=Tortispora caseinolytica NRRL Y-17796 TaxID=767744 RepID=A0A1E4TID3_9ASCO|nr:hypothetical protein CANCADRAFT_60 [Tortispora caseinolytica NRRL Y-17796]
MRNYDSAYDKRQLMQRPQRSHKSTPSASKDIPAPAVQLDAMSNFPVFRGRKVNVMELAGFDVCKEALKPPVTRTRRADTNPLQPPKSTAELPALQLPGRAASLPTVHSAGSTLTPTSTGVPRVGSVPSPPASSASSTDSGRSYGTPSGSPSRDPMGIATAISHDLPYKHNTGAKSSRESSQNIGMAISEPTIPQIIPVRPAYNFSAAHNPVARVPPIEHEEPSLPTISPLSADSSRNEPSLPSISSLSFNKPPEEPSLPVFSAGISQPKQDKAEKLPVISRELSLANREPSLPVITPLVSSPTNRDPVLPTITPLTRNRMSDDEPSLPSISPWTAEPNIRSSTAGNSPIIPQTVLIEPSLPKIERNGSPAFSEFHDSGYTSKNISVASRDPNSPHSSFASTPRRGSGRPVYGKEYIESSKNEIYGKKYNDNPLNGNSILSGAQLPKLSTSNKDDEPTVPTFDIPDIEYVRPNGSSPSPPKIRPLVAPAPLALDDKYLTDSILSAAYTPSSAEPSPATFPEGRPKEKSRKPPKICRGCGEVIKGKSVSASNGAISGRWHRACMACQECRAPFENGVFYVFNDLPYCKRDFHILNNSACSRCAKPIEGKCLEIVADNANSARQLVHPECMRCTTCGDSLNNEYIELGGNPFCEQHGTQLTNRSDGQLVRRRTRLYH